MADSRQIHLMNGGASFSPTNTTSRTVAELKQSQGITDGATVNVNGVSVEDGEEINDGDYIAVVKRDKTGGCAIIIIRL